MYHTGGVWSSLAPPFERESVAPPDLGICGRVDVNDVWAL
jgi:hypothetical protein